jgi:hypothetical protein
VQELATLNRRPNFAADSTTANDLDQRRRRGRLPVAAGRGFVVALVFLPLLMASSACRSGRGRGSDVAVLEPSALPTPEPAPPIELPIATPTPAAVMTPLELADLAFEAGDYQGARGGYESHLAGPDAAVDADRVLYRLAILNLASNGGGRDPAAGYALLRRLVREHAGSPYRMEADLILGLNARADGLATEVEKLESQLEALKRIDLERTQDRRSP